MLNDTAISAPFAVTAVNALQVAHFLAALALYYRCHPKSPRRARIQLALAGATHTALLLVLFLLPFLGWSQDWASGIAMGVWGAWELAVMFALQSIYRFRLQREQRYQVLSGVAFVGYVLSATAYGVLRLVLGTRSLTMDLALFVVECVAAGFVVAFMALLLVHTTCIRFTLFVAIPQPERD